MDDFYELIPVEDAFAIIGVKHSTGYGRINSGLLAPPIRIGPQAKRCLRGECIQVRNAHIAGKTEDEIRALVQKQIAARARVAEAA